MGSKSFNPDQKKAIKIDAGKFVTANAGSGKTTILTERFIAIINKKVDKLGSVLSNAIISHDHFYLSQEKTQFDYNIVKNYIISYLYDSFDFDFIVVVSFSENTVASLKEKINEKIQDEFNSNTFNLNNLETLDKNNLSLFIKKQIYKYLIEEFTKFQISTIHGFCNNVIDKYAHKLNISVPYIKNDLYLEEKAKNRVQIIINDRLLFSLYIKENNITVNNESIDQERFLQILSNLYYLYDELNIQSLIQALFSKATGNNLYKLSQSIEYFKIQKELENTNNDGQGDEIYGHAIEFNEDIYYFLSVVFELKNVIHSQYNLVNFDNQLYRVYQFLNVSENAVLVGKKIEHLMVDEFQDTDFIQYEIFKNLIDNNTNIISFFVGDPKQSVYRFRSADVNVFRQAENYFCRKTNRAESVILDYSYRNTPLISTFVNHNFNQIVSDNSNTTKDKGKDKTSSKYFQYENLVYPLKSFNDFSEEQISEAGKSINLAGKIEYYVNYKTEKNEDKVRDWHYYSLAKYIQELVGTTISTNVNGEIVEKEVKYSDIAILKRQRSNIDKFLEYFDHLGIPYDRNSSVNFYQLKEIEAAISFLKFVNNPSDNEAAIKLLTSSFFGISLESLLLLSEILIIPNFSSTTPYKYTSLWERLQVILAFDHSKLNTEFLIEPNTDEDTAESSYDSEWRNKITQYFTDNNEFIGHIKEVINSLHIFIQIKSRVFTSELLTMFLKSNFYHRTNKSQDDLYYENLYKLTNILHDIEEQGFISFQDVAERLNEQNKNKEVKEDDIKNKAKDKVSLYTFHGSKGLEFPIVIVLDGGENTNATITEIEKEFGFYYNKLKAPKECHNEKLITYVKHLENFGKEKPLGKEYLEYKKLDSLNLFYVALTRAQSALCFFLEAGREITKKGVFNASDLNKWDYFGREKIDSTFSKKQASTQEGIEVGFYTSKEELDFHSDSGKENTITIPISYKFVNLTNSSQHYTSCIKNLKLKNIPGQIKAQNAEEENTDIPQDIKVEVSSDNSFNSISNFSTKNYLFSATKLMTISEENTKYEAKYILGSDTETETEFVAHTNKREYDDEYFISQKNLENAAHFGNIFHSIIQYIVLLYPEGKLDEPYLETLITKSKPEYSSLSREQFEKLKKIFIKMSGTSFIKEIIKHKANLKTEFKLKMPFEEIPDHFVNGNIDLIYKDAEGNYTIIDWKTNNKFTLDTTPEKYSIQYQLYSYLIQKLDKNAKVYFYLVPTTYILESNEEYWKVSYNSEFDNESAKNNIQKLINTALELESSLYGLG